MENPKRAIFFKDSRACSWLPWLDLLGIFLWSDSGTNCAAWQSELHGSNMGKIFTGAFSVPWSTILLSRCVFGCIETLTWPESCHVAENAMETGYYVAEVKRSRHHRCACLMHLPPFLKIFRCDSRRQLFTLDSTTFRGSFERSLKNGTHLLPVMICHDAIWIFLLVHMPHCYDWDNLYIFVCSILWIILAFLFLNSYVQNETLGDWTQLEMVLRECKHGEVRGKCKWSWQIERWRSFRCKHAFTW